MRYFYSIFLSIFSSICVAQSYQAQQLKSSDLQVSLIELYTSEGCSSCPPADEWMSTLTEKTHLWKDFVPVAFHVDYWDYLGWIDRFADPKNTKRQRQYAYESRERTIYTPGFRAEGKDWRSWHNSDLEKSSEIDREKVGVLSLNITADGSFDSDFIAVDGNNDPAKKLTVVLLGLGLETSVKRGENWGKKLKHDFVVLQSQTFKRQKNGWKGKLPVSSHIAPKYAIAAWVDDGKSLKPIQVVGAYL
jgi:hypothetical protein